jgi:hypothetical protein
VGFFVGEALIAPHPPTPERRAAFLEYHVDLIACRLDPNEPRGAATS